MSFRFIAFSDIHLNRGVEYDLDPLEAEIASREGNLEIDALMALGDIVDNIPRDRVTEEDIKRDIETGRGFFRDLSKIAENQDVPTYAVPGNHDHDIFEEIISSPSGEIFYGIRDARTSSLHRAGDKTYGVVGKDVSSFDIGPEIDLEKYGIDDLSGLTDLMSDVVEGNLSAEQATERLEVSAENYTDFREDIQEFIREYGALENEFEKLHEDVTETQTIFMSHIAPFNTKLDSKTIGKETSEHGGSIVNRIIIEYMRPRLALNGHHDYHEVEYFPAEADFDLDSYGIGIDEAIPTEIEITEEGISIQERY